MKARSSQRARFAEVDSTAVIQAATDAGLHDFILSLPEDTIQSWAVMV